MSVTAPNAHFYAVYIRGAQWRERRRGALEDGGYRCARCHGEDELEVHHLNYDRLGNERPTDLRVLCNPCHADEHGRPAKHDRVVSVGEASAKENARVIALERLEDEQQALLDSFRRAPC